MVTASKVLKALVAANLAESASMKRVTDADHYTGGSLTWTDPDVKSAQFSVSSETYGTRISELYFRCKSVEIAQQVARTVESLGGKPNFGWNSDYPNMFSLPVSPFKGYHWWE